MTRHERRNVAIAIDDQLCAMLDDDLFTAQQARDVIDAIENLRQYILGDDATRDVDALRQASFLLDNVLRDTNARSTDHQRVTPQSHHVDADRHMMTRIAAQ